MEDSKNVAVHIEIPILKWTNYVNGWKKRHLILDEYFIHIVKSKTMPSKNNISSYDLSIVRMLDEGKKKQFILLYEQKKIACKVDKDEDKTMILEQFNLAIRKLKTHHTNIISQTNNINHKESNQSLTQSQSSNSQNQSQVIKQSPSPSPSPSPNISPSINHNKTQVKIKPQETKTKESKHNKTIVVTLVELEAITEQINGLNSTINQLQLMSKEVKKKSRDSFNHSIAKLGLSHSLINESIKSIMSRMDHRVNHDNLSQIFHNETKIINLSQDAHIDSSFEEEDPEEICSSQERLDESIIIKSKFESSLSMKQNDFYDSNYLNINRHSLPIQLKPSSALLADLVKSLTNKHVSLPIHYNEPLSMLQRQCEKFFYSDLLLKASAKTVPNELKMCYIAGFIVGEVSQNINRFLKPFNPILGETFEFFDNERKFRYFAEQVCHKPPISAFLCESNDYVVFGDTRFKSSFKIMKGAMEIDFTNKTHILFKQDNNLTFTFTKPKAYLKGVISGTLKYDFGGKVVIECCNDPSIHTELEFIEDAWKKDKDYNSIEGSVFMNGEVVYNIKGNWHESLHYYNKKGEDKKEIWTIHQEPYLNNSFETYTIPEYSLQFNNITKELDKVLPPTDSRKRPDQREYENGSIAQAEAHKERIEERQRERHKKLEDDKVIYTPVYFQNNYETSSLDFVYIYNGLYFEDRKHNNFPKLNNIF